MARTGTFAASALAVVAALTVGTERVEACSLYCDYVIYPADGKTSVPTNTRLWFSGTFGLEEVVVMDPAGGTVAYAVENGPEWSLVRPEAPLLPNTTYTVVVDLYGTTFEFTTGDGPDLTPPAPPRSVVTDGYAFRGNGFGDCGSTRGLDVEFVSDDPDAVVVATFLDTAGRMRADAYSMSDARDGIGGAGGFCFPALEVRRYDVAIVAFDGAGNASTPVDAGDVQVPTCSVVGTAGRPVRGAPGPEALVVTLFALVLAGAAISRAGGGTCRRG